MCVTFLLLICCWLLLIWFGLLAEPLLVDFSLPGFLVAQVLLCHSTVETICVQLVPLDVGGAASFLILPGHGWKRWKNDSWRRLDVGWLWDDLWRWWPSVCVFFLLALFFFFWDSPCSRSRRLPLWCPTDYRRRRRRSCFLVAVARLWERRRGWIFPSPCPGVGIGVTFLVLGSVLLLVEQVILRRKVYSLYR